MEKSLNVAFVGNPNCGKTTLFNAYTGAKLKVANWPGVSVEKKEGSYKYQGNDFKLVDLPGIYSLTSYSMEEKVSRQYILDDEVDVVVDIADASSLERNLYLTLQLIELGKPVVLALNMMDIVEQRGMEIDLHRLPEMLGIPVVPVSARKKKGLDILMHAVVHHKDKKLDNLEHEHKNNKMSKHKHDHHQECVVVYSDEIEEKIDLVSERLENTYGVINNVRWHAIKLLEMDIEIQEKYPVDLSDIIDRNYEADITNQKYDFIEEIIEEVLVNKDEKAEATDKIDSVLTNRYFGIPVFLIIMALVFFFTFTIGDFLKGGFEVGLDAFSETTKTLLESLNVGATLTSLIVDGIIAGVGGILTFLPNIFILFLALGFLEDSGYMARVAYVMDGLMGKMGLSGRAFIPMILGYGCTVPAVMAARTLEDEKDRLKTILITPFMSCSARLPIYVLFSEVFFPNYAMAVAFSMYVIGLVVAILVAIIAGKIGYKKEVNTLLIELPEYKAPNARTIAIYVWEKVKDYLSKAGTTIFVASIFMWFILNFNFTGMVEDISQSFGASIGRGLVPVLKPAGLGMWQIVVALISGIAAKEVVVSSFTVLFSVSNITSVAGMAAMAGSLGEYGFGPLNAYSLMIFCLLYTPCMATIATVKKETNSWKFTIFMILFQLAVAWGMSTLVFQIGSLF
ncbi:ferrous iron transport protein B [Clostridium saccharoperbutylacetonicum]|uniref:Ferrous iron transport protein B n=1 Tax=Clostridium saccharoperbutylacetonicum N1-4(HMT) TaxID=931276 RepID=M1N2I0_9CLOT|nr:ferrous iron transport protein B [Clostridium saccharoperbutylacetonicum]AGF57672.1 ferrous iron transport protein B [Clostridium saccharoperbutylacetonicum N1-4(HMT)]NRT61560.1 ferrous iron transport protein B [Clostridium saccharoperbutylacetonicum]NSB24883.1 ferrous iron transport protein B [Clostridium saccharoperbutylacetonicum]NSB44254.1 ferrous iron transport protein B [Clostridium saccharoperbutylacetonicum]